MIYVDYAISQPLSVRSSVLNEMPTLCRRRPGFSSRVQRYEEKLYGAIPKNEGS